MIISANGIRMFVEIKGAGSPLVLLHGYPLNHTIWNEVVSLLVDQAQVITPDLRGHGQTEAPKGTYAMSLLAKDIASLLDALGINRAVLVGHSMGGYASLAFARDYPGRLAGLGLVASQAAADSPDRRAGRYVTAADVEKKGVGVIAPSMAEKLVAKKEFVNRLEKVILATPVDGVIGALKGMAERPDMTDFLPRILVPSLVVAGDTDAIIPMDRAHEMDRLLPRNKMVSLTGVGHMPMLEAPLETAYALGTLLNVNSA